MERRKETKQEEKSIDEKSKSIWRDLVAPLCTPL